MTDFGWVMVAILLLLIISSSYPKLGGWLLVMLTMGMVYNGQKYLT